MINFIKNDQEDKDPTKHQLQDAEFIAGLFGIQDLVVIETFFGFVFESDKIVDRVNRNHMLILSDIEGLSWIETKDKFCFAL